MDYGKMQLKDIIELPGIEDLRPKASCRGKFALALKAEDRDDPEKAESLLDQACKAEI